MLRVCKQRNGSRPGPGTHRLRVQPTPISPFHDLTTKILTSFSNSNGSPVVITDCTGSNDQLWTFKNGAVTAYGGTKCLDATDGVNSNGVKLQIWDCWPSSVNQQWWWTGDNHLAWTNHGRCVDLTDGSLANGNRVQIWDCSGCVEAFVFASSLTPVSQRQRQSKYIFAHHFFAVRETNPKYSTSVERRLPLRPPPPPISNRSDWLQRLWYWLVFQRQLPDPLYARTCDLFTKLLTDA